MITTFPFFPPLAVDTTPNSVDINKTKNKPHQGDSAIVIILLVPLHHPMISEPPLFNTYLTILPQNSVNYNLIKTTNYY